MGMPPPQITFLRSKTPRQRPGWVRTQEKKLKAFSVKKSHRPTNCTAWPWSSYKGRQKAGQRAKSIHLFVQHLGFRRLGVPACKKVVGFVILLQQSGNWSSAGLTAEPFPNQPPSSDTSLSDVRWLCPLSPILKERRGQADFVRPKADLQDSGD